MTGRRSLPLAVLLAAGIVGISHAPGQEDRDPPADPANGKGIVVGTYSDEAEGACFQCHGIDGAGDAVAGYPRLTGQYEDYLYAALQDYAAGFRPNAIMEPIARALTDQQMRDVSAYYAAQRDAPYSASPRVEPELVERGRRLASRGAPGQGVSPCANCHGADGVGQPPDFPFLAGQGAAYLEQQLLLWKRGIRSGDEGGIMAHIARRLSYDQIRAVSAYYASLEPAEVTPVAATDGGSDAHPAQ